MFNKKEWSKQYHIDNKEERNKRSRQWNIDNEERKKKNDNQWRLDNLEKANERQKRWYKRHPEKVKEVSKQYRKDNKEEILKYQAEYFKTESGKASAQRGSSKRRIKMREIINTLTSQEWLDILEEHDYRCAYCGVEFDCENLPTRDYIIPLSKGGYNIKENIVPACRSCNSKKHNRIIKIRKEETNEKPQSLLRISEKFTLFRRSQKGPF